MLTQLLPFGTLAAVANDRMKMCEGKLLEGKFKYGRVDVWKAFLVFCAGLTYITGLLAYRFSECND